MKRLMCLMAMVGMVSVTASAGMLDLKEVDSKALWLLHANVGQFKQTAIGKALLVKLGEGKEAQKLDALAAIVGMDMRKDVDGITMYGSSPDKKQAVIVISGTFNAAQVVTLLKANDSYQVSAHQGVEIHDVNNPKKNERLCIAFPKNGVAVMGGDAAQVAKALDVLAGRAVSLATENPEGLKAAGDSNSAFLQGAAIMSKLCSPGDPRAQTFKAGKAGAMSVGSDGDKLAMKVEILADSQESAQQMESAARGIMAMMLLSDKTDQTVRDMIGSTDIKRLDSTVSATLQFSEEKAVEMMLKNWGKGRCHEHDESKGDELPEATE